MLPGLMKRASLDPELVMKIAGWSVCSSSSSLAPEDSYN